MVQSYSFYDWLCLKKSLHWRLHCYYTKFNSCIFSLALCESHWWIFDKDNNSVRKAAEKHIGLRQCLKARMPALRPFLTCDKCLSGTALEALNKLHVTWYLMMATNPFVNYLKISNATNKNQRNIVFKKNDILKSLVIPRNNIA